MFLVTFFHTALFSVGLMKPNQQWTCLFNSILGRLTGVLGCSIFLLICFYSPSSSLVVFFDFDHNKNELEGGEVKICDQKRWKLGPSYWLMAIATTIVRRILSLGDIFVHLLFCHKPCDQNFEMQCRLLEIICFMICVRTYITVSLSQVYFIPRSYEFIEKQYIYPVILPSAPGT